MEGKKVVHHGGCGILIYGRAGTPEERNDGGMQAYLGHFLLYRSRWSAAQSRILLAALVALAAADPFTKFQPVKSPTESMILVCPLSCLETPLETCSRVAV